MKITFVLKHSGLSGGVRVVGIYADRLARRGHTVTVASVPVPHPRLRTRVRHLLSGRGWPRAEEGPSHLDRFDIEQRILERCRPVVDADLPRSDVIVATWWETSEWVARMSPDRGAKCYFLQGFEVFDSRNAERVERSWRLPFHKITVSRWLTELARDRFGDPHASHAPNGVDMAEFFADPRPRNAVPTVGFLAHPHWVKGTDVVRDALRQVCERLPSVRLLAFGAETPRHPAALPSGTEFHLRPSPDQLRQLYRRCDVWVCGSRMEGFHLPPLEAMACRVPVVSTRVGGPLDIIEEGRNGFLVNVEDSDGLAAMTHRVVTCPPADWRRLSDAAYETATAHDWDDATDRFERALELAIDRARKGEIAGGRETLAS